MREEDKDKVLAIAKKFVPPEKLTDFARELDRIETEKELSIVELVDRIAELIARLTADELFSIRDPELKRLYTAVAKTSIKYLLGPKLMEIFIRSTVQAVER